MKLGIFAELAFRNYIPLLRSLTLDQAVTLRKVGLELLAHRLLEELAYNPGLERLTLTSAVNAQSGARELRVDYHGDEQVEMKPLEFFTEAFPEELFADGVLSIDQKHEAVARVANAQGLPDHLVAVAMLATEMNTAFALPPGF